MLNKSENFDRHFRWNAAARQPAIPIQTSCYSFINDSSSNRDERSGGNVGDLHELLSQLREIDWTELTSPQKDSAMSMASFEIASGPTASSTTVPVVPLNGHPRSSQDRERISSLNRLYGMAIVALLPALFWTTIVWTFSSLVGFAISLPTLCIMFGSIAIFLSVIGSALMAGE